MWGNLIDLPKISSVCTGAEICAHPDRCFDAVGNEHRHLVCGFGSFDRNTENWVGYLITALLGILYGPFTAAIAAGAGDIIKYLLKPDGAYFFGFTLTAMLGGMVYGCFLYREKCTIFRAIASKSLISLLLNCCLNTFWISLLYGMPFLGALGPRVIKNVVALPFEIILLYIVLNGMSKVVDRARLH